MFVYWVTGWIVGVTWDDLHVNVCSDGYGCLAALCWGEGRSSGVGLVG